jgi:hypothetical protein
LELADALPHGLLDDGLEGLGLGELLDCSELGEEEVHGGDE